MARILPFRGYRYDGNKIDLRTALSRHRNGIDPESLERDIEDGSLARDPEPAIYAYYLRFERRPDRG